MIWKRVLLGVVVLPMAASVALGGAERKADEGATLKIQSAAFKEGESIPVKYTCDGQDVSPPLRWDAPPTGTVSLVLIVDDPDAPAGTWVHWVLFNAPGKSGNLPEHVSHDKVLKDGARQGTNDFKRIGYGGPCPPAGRGAHRYFFKLYALDTTLDLPAGSTKAAVEKAMTGHILSTGRLMGKYERK